jgi:hypothetical protein
MEIREVTTYNERAPFTGYGVWVVFELVGRKAQLIHPIHLTELMLSEYEYVQSCGNSLWPYNNTGTSFNVDRFKRNLKERIEFFVRTKKSFPIQTVAKIIAELDEIEVSEALKYISSLGVEATEDEKPVSMAMDKASREYSLRKDVDISNIAGRPRVIVEVIRESGPASIYQITHLVTGRLKTKCGISRTVTYFVHKLASQGILEIVT